MEEYISGAERLASIGLEGVLSVVIVLAMVIALLIAYSLRTSGMSGLTGAIDSLGKTIDSQSKHQDALGKTIEAQIRHQTQMEAEFNSLVKSISQIAEILKDVEAMKEDIDYIKQDSIKAATDSQRVLDSIDARLHRMEQSMDTLLLYLSNEVIKKRNDKSEDQ